MPCAMIARYVISATTACACGAMRTRTPVLLCCPPLSALGSSQDQDVLCMRAGTGAPVNASCMHACRGGRVGTPWCRAAQLDRWPPRQRTFHHLGSHWSAPACRARGPHLHISTHSHLTHTPSPSTTHDAAPHPFTPPPPSPPSRPPPPRTLQPRAQSLHCKPSERRQRTRRRVAVALGRAWRLTRLPPTAAGPPGGRRGALCLPWPGA